MKMTKYDRPVKKAREGHRPGRAGSEDSIAAKCRAVGTKTPPGTIISRMKRHGLTFEEALVWEPTSKTTVGKKGKDRSYWAKPTPGSKLSERT